MISVPNNAILKRTLTAFNILNSDCQQLHLNFYVSITDYKKIIDNIDLLIVDLSIISLSIII